MTQDVSHLFEAGTVVENLGRAVCRKIWLAMLGACRDTGMLQRLSHHPPDRAVGQRLKRGPAAQKDLATGTVRSPALHVGHHRLADALWEGQAAGLAGFAGTQV